MAEVFTIIKNDHLGNEVWRYPGKLIAQSDKGLLLEAHFNRADLEFNGVLLKKDDLFLELYLHGKYFNIYQIYDRDSRLLKAWYCNVTRPVQVNEDIISYDDLALDLLVFPDGCQMSLDVDEFMVLTLDEDLKRKALLGLHELQNLFEQNPDLDVRQRL